MAEVEANVSDRTCLSYWFPIIEAAGIPVPKTQLVTTEIELADLLDGHTPDGFEEFCAELERAGDVIGGRPFFLRTGHGSGKHDWRDTCFVDQGSIVRHVVRLVDWSHSVDMWGLPHDVWAVRQLLPTRPLFVCEGFGGFPVVPEVRVFIRGDKIEHAQPYWPPEAVEQGLPDRDDWRDLLDAANTVALLDVVEWTSLAEQAAEAIMRATGEKDLFWSMDFLKDEYGNWWLTDMADGDRSFRWDST